MSEKVKTCPFCRGECWTLIFDHLVLVQHPHNKCFIESVSCDIDQWNKRHEQRTQDIDFKKAVKWIKDSVEKCPLCSDLVVPCRDCIKKNEWLEKVRKDGK